MKMYGHVFQCSLIAKLEYLRDGLAAEKGGGKRAKSDAGTIYRISTVDRYLFLSISSS